MSEERKVAVIEGLGTAVPEGTLRQAGAAALAREISGAGPDEAASIEALFRRTGVRRRGSVLLDPGESGRQSFYRRAAGPGDRGPAISARMERFAAAAGPLAARAAREALADAGVPPPEVTDLVAVSCTGFGAPGFDTELADRLELRRDVRRTLVGFMGCHGLLNGLRTAEAAALARPGSVVLVAAVELCTLHFRYGAAREGGVANALFADGAAALVVRARTAADAGEAAPKPLAKAGPRWRVRATGSWLAPDSRDAMTWRIGDHGFEMTLSPRVPDLVEAALPGWLEGWLAEASLRRTDIRSWAVHPGGPRILEAVERSLELPAGSLDVSRGVLADHGNMSSATLALVLQRLAEQEALRPCVALAFGPGLAIEGALLD